MTILPGMLTTLKVARGAQAGTMTDIERTHLLRRTAAIADAYLDGLAPGRWPGPSTSLRSARPWADPLPKAPSPIRPTSSSGWRRRPTPGSSRSAGPRYFGFVIGGSLPAAMAADWLTSAWDQNAGLYVISPAAAVAEEVAAAGSSSCWAARRDASVGLRDGRDDGQRHVPGRGRARGARAGRLGRRGGRAVAAPRGRGHRRSEAHVTVYRRAPSSWAAVPTGSPGSTRTTRAGCDQSPAPGCSPAPRARPSCAPRPAT